MNYQSRNGKNYELTKITLNAANFMYKRQLDLYLELLLCFKKVPCDKNYSLGIDTNLFPEEAFSNTIFLILEAFKSFIGIIL